MHTFVFQLPTSADDVAPLTFAAVHHTAAVDGDRRDRLILPAGPTATNPLR